MRCSDDAVSRACPQILQKFTRSDRFGLEIVVPAGFLVSETSDPKADPKRIVPEEDVILYCAAFACLRTMLCVHTSPFQRVSC